jgi:4-amino-4-deoxy-L-arabinose transferase-like glycosyltransferase
MSSVRDAVLLSILTVAILVGFWLLLPDQWQENQNYDYRCCYEPVARNLLAGKGMVFDNGQFASVYPPGYPMSVAAVKLLGGVVGDGIAMKIFIAFCTVATVVILYLMGSAIGGVWLGRLSGLAVLGYPFFLWLAKQPNSETPFIPLLALSIYAYVRLIQCPSNSSAVWRWAALCGCSAALAALVRPMGLFTALVLAACAWYAMRETTALPRRTAIAAVLMAVNVLTVLPWEVYLHEQRGGWPLLADNAGLPFYQGVTFGVDKPDLHAVPVPADVLELMVRADARESEVRKLGGLLRFLADEAASHPTAFAKLIWLKITRVWFATHSTKGVQASTLLIQLLFTAIAMAGLWMLRRSAPGAVLALLVLTLYFWAMGAMVLPLLRYLVPITVILAVGVGASAVAVLRRFGFAGAAATA